VTHFGQLLDLQIELIVFLFVLSQEILQILMNVMKELVDFLHGRFAGNLSGFGVLKQRTLEELSFLILFQIVMINFVK